MAATDPKSGVSDTEIVNMAAEMREPVQDHVVHDSSTSTGTPSSFVIASLAITFGIGWSSRVEAWGIEEGGHWARENCTPN